VLLDGQAFPLDPASVPPETWPVTDHARIDLLERQHFRPAYWKISNEEGNYRRFFDIDGLVGVRVEDPAVFWATHQETVHLAADLRVAGVRVDHIDGLADPTAYLARLRSELGGTDACILVEKILCGDETMSPEWDVGGTTGYEFGTWAGGLFVDPAGADALSELGGELGGPTSDYPTQCREAKREIIGRSFGSALNRLVRLAAGALTAEEPGHDLSPQAIAQALTELTVHLDTYRTYIRDGEVARSDRARLRTTLTRARTDLTVEGRRAASRIAQGIGDLTRAEWLELAIRWQQFSGAVMAKGVEDTASYRWSGLLSHAEVGSDPARPEVDPNTFFKQTATRARHWPASLNTTSTHDSKRSEDARCRLMALSEDHATWETLVHRWRRRHAAAIEGRGGPDVRDELFIYQSAVAVWPWRGAADAGVELRLADYVIKALRESKRRTSWTQPDERYEAATREFVQQLLGSGNRFGTELGHFIRRIGPAAATNSLSLTVLKCVCPGVPDVYQGTELWNLSLTDPDNRRPVDFTIPQDMLDRWGDEPQSIQELLAGWTGGAPKLHVLRSLLTLRRRHPALFAQGSYLQLEVSGPRSDHVMAIGRRLRHRWVLAVVPRLMLSMAGPDAFPIGSALWRGTWISLPQGAPDEFASALSGTSIRTRSAKLAVGELLRDFPVAVVSNCQ
jgi:(1->4)-alpha-D-glucan 1-alpha-D-glucosylmutase